MIVKGVEYMQLYRKKSVWACLVGRGKSRAFPCGHVFGVFATMPHHCTVPGCASNSRMVVSMSIQLTEIFIVCG